ncbi:noroxomaritidine synthase-like [Typha latifolia]|uniref:noroxomaritidine synthase-like n=1 Tax=Typha latifolia TaxID=4733 RepID=UPI003C2DBBA3
MAFPLSWVPRTLLSPIQNYPEFLLAIACFLILSRLSSRQSRLPVTWPVVGMLPSVLGNCDRLHDWITDVLRLSGCTFVLKGPWSSFGDVIMTCDPANVNHVFTANFANYPKGGDFAKIFGVLGNGIFNADGKSWAFQRKKAHGLIASPKFREFVANSTRDKLESSLIPLLDHLSHEGKEFDLQDVFLRLTFDTTAMFVFGIDPGCLSIEFPTLAFAKAMDDAEEILFYRHIAPKGWQNIEKRFNFGHHKKMERAKKVIDKCIAQYISIKRKLTNDGDDLLTSYLDCQAEVGKDGAAFENFLRDTAFNFMVAGRDTTSSALTWFFYLLSKNPHVEAKIVQELKLHAPKNPSFPSSTQLREMTYLHAALCESLRLYPPVPFEHKEASSHDVLPSGIEISPRRRLLLSLYAMARVEGIWGKDCMEFKPERWLSESGRIRHEPSYKFLTFNSGPRTCLGKDMAMMQLKAVAAAMVSRFQIRVANDFVVKPKLSIILHMKGGLKVTVKKREGYSGFHI